jgi:hypothetical protein
MNNKTPISVQYNTDIVESGIGINVDKSIPNKIKINRLDQEYTLPILYSDYTYPLNTPFEINISNPIDLNQIDPYIYFELNGFTNRINIYHTNSLFDGTLRILIDDGKQSWKKGQCLKIYFYNQLNLNSKSIKIYTDKRNIMGFNNTIDIINYEIATLLESDLISNKPIIEIVCVDEIDYKFVVDILR